MTDIVERLRNCGIDDAISMMTEAAAELERLRKVEEHHDQAVERAERLEAALLTVPCPGGGYTGMPANTEPTVAACMAAGVCGCIYGDALGAKRQPSVADPTNISAP